MQNKMNVKSCIRTLQKINSVNREEVILIELIRNIKTTWFQQSSRIKLTAENGQLYPSRKLWYRKDCSLHQQRSSEHRHKSTVGRLSKNSPSLTKNKLVIRFKTKQFWFVLIEMKFI